MLRPGYALFKTFPDQHPQIISALTGAVAEQFVLSHKVYNSAKMSLCILKTSGSVLFA